MATITERLAKANQLHRAGRVAEAEALYQGILQEAPEHSQTLFFLGSLFYEQRKYQQAIDLLLRCLHATGPNAVCETNLAGAYVAAGKFAEGAAYARRALARDPSLALAHHNLGIALYRQGLLAESETAYREAVRLMPTNPEPLCDLAVVLKNLGRIGDAMVYAQEGVRLSPYHPRAHYELGLLYLISGMREEAIRHFRECIRLNPKFPPAHTHLGIALRDSGDIVQGEQCLRESLRLNAAEPDVHVNLGNTLLALGRIDDARAEFDEALRLQPQNTKAFAALSNLASVGKFQFSAERIRHLEDLGKAGTLSGSDGRYLHFALGSIFDKAEEPAKAFEHFRLANELRRDQEQRRGLIYDPAKQDDFVDRLIASYTPAFFERVRGYGFETERPIFVVGMMRSGTTLVEQILSSHPSVYAAGELVTMGALVSSLPFRLGVTAPYPECVRHLNADSARQLGAEYEQTLLQRAGSALRVVDKLPANFLNLGLIAALLPKARLVHCRRDPVDTCLSCYFKDFAQPIPYTWDLRHLGHYFRAYRRMMAHWAEVLPIPIFDLCYEDLTADQEAVTRRLIDFCHLPWDDRCLKPQDSSRHVWTASVLQVRQPIYRDAVGRWKRYEPFLQPLLAELNR